MFKPTRVWLVLLATPLGGCVCSGEPLAHHVACDPDWTSFQPYGVMTHEADRIAPPRFTLQEVIHQCEPWFKQQALTCAHYRITEANYDVLNRTWRLRFAFDAPTQIDRNATPPIRNVHLFFNEPQQWIDPVGDWPKAEWVCPDVQ